MKKFLLLLCIACTTAVVAYSQQTVGLFTYNQEKSFNGLTLFNQMSSKTTYLLDNCGRVVHKWESNYTPGHSQYLLEDGSILRAGSIEGSPFNAGGTGGLIERINWEGKVTWTYVLSNDTIHQHHDLFPLKNGNILVIVWHKLNNAQAKAAGRTQVLTDLWSEKILELKPTGPISAEVVWEWRVWDHLIQDVDAAKPNFGVVKDHPERININHASTPIPDWLHFNSVAYNEDLDQIVISSHNSHELWIIDHSTTTAEAATSKGGKYGKGGDLLYRWGNPAMYNAGTATDQLIRGQHSVHWIPKGLTDAGNIMIFNNRAGGSGANVYSTVDIIKPPMDEQGNYKLEGAKFGPDSAYWRYYGTPRNSFFSTNIASAQRLPNGNTLICSGAPGIFFEITPDNEIVWKYINPIKQGVPVKQGDSISFNPVFRATRYPYEYLKGKTLVGGNPIELEPLPSACQLPTSVDDIVTTPASYSVTPNPTNGVFTVTVTLQHQQHTSVQLCDVLGKVVQQVADAELTSGLHNFTVQANTAGMMYVRILCAEQNVVIPIVCTK
ncbi:MAG: aryl-sulfate sulfotransferase [Candidatus Kapaibacterium sp.]